MALNDCDTNSESFQLAVRDTLMVIGKGLMEAGNEVYGEVKKEAKKNNSMNPLAASLGEFYQKSKKENKEDTSKS